jgi:hypothetical protein
MDTKIKLLEEKVSQAVEKIRNLADERKRLIGELGALRDQAATLEKNRTSPSEEFSAEDWTRKTSEIDGMIEEAIRALDMD